MSDFLKAYYDTEGPFGLPMKDKQALALEKILRTLPREDCYRPRKAVIEQAPAETLAGERCDVSWVSTEDPDREQEVVRARGMDDAHFQLNPIVTLQHAYWLPPVGRSLWRKRVKDGERVGIKAKTQYPPRPASWPTDAEWPADCAFALVQADLLRGKSIGFLPTKVHVPDDKERQRDGWANVRLVVDEWVLLEYACVFLPAQQHAVVESVSKALLARLMPRTIPFTPLDEIERALERQVQGIDVEALVQESLDRLRGRV